MVRSQPRNLAKPAKPKTFGRYAWAPAVEIVVIRALPCSSAPRPFPEHLAAQMLQVRTVWYARIIAYFLYHSLDYSLSTSPRYAHVPGKDKICDVPGGTLYSETGAV